MEAVPKDGTLLDVHFDVATAERGMAEFYAPGCTAAHSTIEPIIENVAFINGGFSPVIDRDAARAVAAAGGGFARVDGIGYAVSSVTLKGWRPAAYPPVS